MKSVKYVPIFILCLPELRTFFILGEVSDGIAEVWVYAYGRDMRQPCTVFLTCIWKTKSHNDTVVSLALSDEPTHAESEPQSGLLPE